MTTAQDIEQLTAWRRAGKHLPRFMRDFHDQKLLFKFIHDQTGAHEPSTNGFTPPSWVDAQIYVIDYFLWCMARHGFTLQRCRASIPFADLGAEMQAFEKQQRNQAWQLLAAEKGQTP